MPPGLFCHDVTVSARRFNQYSCNGFRIIEIITVDPWSAELSSVTQYPVYCVVGGLFPVTRRPESIRNHARQIIISVIIHYYRPMLLLRELLRLLNRLSHWVWNTLVTFLRSLEAEVLVSIHDQYILVGSVTQR